jgi:methionyl-tRNA formyltransferase
LAVDWNWPTERILRRIRALSPVPGLAVEVSELRFFVTEAEPAAEFVTALEPGEAAVVGDPGTLVVRTADGAIAVLRASLADEDDGDDDAQVLERAALARRVAARLPPAPRIWVQGRAGPR